MVRELDGNVIILGTVGAGQFIGEMGVVENRPRSATIEAIRGCYVQGTAVLIIRSVCKVIDRLKETDQEERRALGFPASLGLISASRRIT